MRNSVLTFKKMKEEGKKISMLTCYDYTTAKLMDGNIDAILVGDSLGNTMLGFGDTIPVTVDHMITYGASVVRGTETTMIVVDMPFMSYQVSMEQALENAGRVMKETHCQAIKLEGGARVCPQIKAMVDAGIPVMAHLGLTPQSINAFGGCRVQGKTEDAAKELLEDAYAVQEAGAFSVVLECIPAPVAALITSKLDIPTIGIGGGTECDGQILVYQDMLGTFTDYVPKFVKQFANIGEEMVKAFKAYDEEVKNKTFPDDEHSFQMKNEEALKRLY